MSVALKVIVVVLPAGNLNPEPVPVPLIGKLPMGVGVSGETEDSFKFSALRFELARA